MKAITQSAPPLYALPCTYNPAKAAAALRTERPPLRPVRTMAEELAAIRDTMARLLADGVIGARR